MTSPSTRLRIEAASVTSLMEAVQKYFDLMYDCDTSRFDDVFPPTVHLHGFRDAEI